MIKRTTTYNSLVRIFTFIWLAFIVSFYISCTSKKNPKKDDTLTSGVVNIAADEAYSTILQDQQFLYEAKYPNAKLNFIFTDENSALDMLVSDTVRMAVVSCEPGDKELAFFKKKGITHHVNHICNDAVVLVVNKECPIDSLSKEQLQRLFSGELTEWKDLAPGNTKAYGKVMLGFNMQGSGIINYFRKYYLPNDKKFPATGFTFKSTFNMLDSVEKHPNIIGFMGYNYISDKDDSLARSIKQRFKIISLESLKEDGQFVLPSQSTIADSAYPLVRKVLVINREGKSGLGTGFVIYMVSHKGQRVMLKAGMVPAMMPGREVRFIKKNIKI